MELQKMTNQFIVFQVRGELNVENSDVIGTVLSITIKNSDSDKYALTSGLDTNVYNPVYFEYMELSIEIGVASTLYLSLLSKEKNSNRTKEIGKAKLSMMKLIFGNCFDVVTIELSPTNNSFVSAKISFIPKTQPEHLTYQNIEFETENLNSNIWYRKSEISLHFFGLSSRNYIKSNDFDEEKFLSIKHSDWVKFKETRRIIPKEFTQTGIISIKHSDLFYENSEKAPIKIAIMGKVGKEPQKMLCCGFTSIGWLTNKRKDSGTTKIGMFDPMIGGFCGNLEILDSHECKTIPLLSLLADGVSIVPFFIIDFTASNGAYLDELSRHSYKNGTNDYMKIMIQIGSIMESFSLKQETRLYCFGFGAKWLQYGHQNVSFDFTLTGNNDLPYVKNTRKLIKEYMNVACSSEFLGPTEIAPSLTKCSSIVARQARKSRKYSVFFVILDDDPQDLLSIYDVLLNSYKLPISIVIIGVGSSNFKSQDYFNIANLKEKIKKQDLHTEDLRDMVIFLNYNDYCTNMWDITKIIMERLKRHIINFYNNLDL